ncbi:response regulator transcription factor [Brevibacillus centrosporus]|uniref:LytR/AlgR family response regulator transcription factor n=1 Tax=Brevibacillus centrosporus TaxID=54910 RepID=UPI002E20FBEC|nr:response regulator transcription factor [Brevibacillus centrosporus]
MFGQLKVLMLEDTEAHQALMTHMLGRVGVTTIALASTPSEFFDILEQRGREFNSFIIDVQLGEGQMDGLSALKKVREKGIDYPAAVVTMDTNGIDYVKSYKLGVTEIIDKERLYTEGVIESLARGLLDKVVYSSIGRGVAMVVPVINEEISFLPASDILYFQLADGAYSIHTYLEEYKTVHNLRTYAKLLENHGFLSVSKNHLINMSKIEALDSLDQTVTFYCDPLNRAIPVAEAKMAAVRKVLKARKI